MAAPGEFELARRVAVRMMETRAFAKDIEEEDATMVKYIPNLRRLNELGMITFDSQNGRRFTFPHYQTGKIIKMSERAYCKGFVDASVAAAVVQWMWDNTDKYVTRAIDIEEASRGDKAIYTVLEEFGQLGVVQKECEGSVSWPAQASPVVMSHDYTSHYGRWIYPEKRGKPPDEDGEKAIRHVGPYMAHPIPRSAVCLLCVDMRLGRRADARDGLFTQIEAALRAASPAPQKSDGAKNRETTDSKRGTKSKKSKRGRGKFTSRSKSAKSATRSRKARGGTRSRCAGARRGRCASTRREGKPRRGVRRARSRGARRS
jgi:hypothetical protein